MPSTKAIVRGLRHNARCNRHGGVNSITWPIIVTNSRAYRRAVKIVEGRNAKH